MRRLRELENRQRGFVRYSDFLARLQAGGWSRVVVVESRQIKEEGVMMLRWKVPGCFGCLEPGGRSLVVPAQCSSKVPPLESAPRR